MPLWSLKRCIHCGIICTMGDIAHYPLIIIHIYEKQSVQTYVGRGTRYHTAFKLSINLGWLRSISPNFANLWISFKEIYFINISKHSNIYGVPKMLGHIWGMNSPHQNRGKKNSYQYTPRKSFRGAAPMCSPDFNPLAFYLWGHVKSPSVFRSNWEHKDTLSVHFRCLSNHSQQSRGVWTVRQPMVRHVQACMDWWGQCENLLWTVNWYTIRTQQ